MKIMKNGELIETHIYINTFYKPDLSPAVRITSLHIEPIDLFIPTPIRCMKLPAYWTLQKKMPKDQTNLFPIL